MTAALSIEGNRRGECARGKVAIVVVATNRTPIIEGALRCQVTKRRPTCIRLTSEEPRAAAAAVAAAVTSGPTQLRLKDAEGPTDTKTHTQASLRTWSTRYLMGQSDHWTTRPHTYDACAMYTRIHKRTYTHACRDQGAKVESHGDHTLRHTWASVWISVRPDDAKPTHDASS